jgi:heme/copper-type cytochrome/quinol oxidase subunit 3
VKQRPVQDVSELPLYSYGHHMTTWWGTLAFVALEGTGFVLAVGVYLYLVVVNPQWPLDAEPPGLQWSSLLTVVLLASIIPNVMVSRVAKKERKGPVLVLLVVMSLVGVVAVGIRALEFTTLNVRWDDNAYGSILWSLLGLHTTHIATDVGDTIVLTILMFTRHGQGKRFSNVEDNAFYWNFVVIAWVPIYALLYWLPRITNHG